MKKDQNGFSVLPVLLFIIVVTVIGFAGWRLYIYKPQELTKLDSGRTLEARFSAFKDSCVQQNKTSPGGTFVPVTHVQDPAYGGGSCYRFQETNGEPDKLDLAVYFPHTKSAVLTAGFYNGSCSSVADRVYEINAIRDGKSTSSIDIDIKKFRGNSSNKANGWVILAVFDKAKTDRPVACSDLSF